MNWNALIIAGDKNSGKTFIMNMLIEKEDQPIPSQAVEYGYIKKRDSDAILDIYTSDMDSIEMLMQQPRKYIFNFTIDLSSNRIDFAQIAYFKPKYPDSECIVVGTRLDLFLLSDKKFQKNNMTVFQLSCKQLKIPYLYISQRHPSHIKYLKAYLLYKGLELEKPEIKFEDYKPEFEIGEITPKQLKSLEQAIVKVNNIPSDTEPTSELGPEPEVDSFCLQVKERLSVLLAGDEKHCTEMIANAKEAVPVIRKWEDIFTLLSSHQ